MSLFLVVYVSVDWSPTQVGSSWPVKQALQELPQLAAYARAQLSDKTPRHDEDFFLATLPHHLHIMGEHILVPYPSTIGTIVVRNERLVELTNNVIAVNRENFWHTALLVTTGRTVAFAGC